jgi:hypothetical protein
LIVPLEFSTRTCLEGRGENKAESINLSILNKTHENKWVALSPDYKKILAVENSLMEVMKVIDQVGMKSRNF